MVRIRNLLEGVGGIGIRGNGEALKLWSGVDRGMVWGDVNVGGEDVDKKGEKIVRLFFLVFIVICYEERKRSV